MIIAKVFEVRDRGTFIPVLAVESRSWFGGDPEQWLFRRAAYNGHILLTHLTSRQTEYDPDVWNNRTMTNAHRYISDNWNSLVSGEVVDVQFILKETDKPCESEREIDG